ncbi:helix-turn-helix domain-containing protein [Acidobacteriota bacterium]
MKQSSRTETASCRDHRGERSLDYQIRNSSSYYFAVKNHVLPVFKRNHFSEPGPWSPAERLIALVIADHMNVKHKGIAWPSYARIARIIRAHSDTVMRAIPALIEGPNAIFEAKPRHGHSTHFKLTPELLLKAEIIDNQIERKRHTNLCKTQHEFKSDQNKNLHQNAEQEVPRPSEVDLNGIGRDDEVVGNPENESNGNCEAKR